MSVSEIEEPGLEEFLRLAMGFVVLVIILGASISALAILVVESSDWEGPVESKGGNGSGPLEKVYRNESHNFGGILVGDNSNDHNWRVEEDAIKLVVVLRWSDTLQDLDVSIGKGQDVDSGIIEAQDSGGSAGSGEGEVVLEIDDPGTLEVSEGFEEQWFVHIEPDPVALNCQYVVDVTVTYCHLE